MVHLIIINWFDWSSVWIWNIFRVGLKWKLWRVNLNITITNGIIIKSSHDIWNHRAGFVSRGPGFEVSCWSLTVPLYWWISWLITTKGIGLVHIYSKTWWKEVRPADNSESIHVYNPSTEFVNNLLPNAEIWHNWLESCDIIVDRRW